MADSQRPTSGIGESMKLAPGIGQLGSLSAGLGASAGMSEAMKLASAAGHLGSLSAGLAASTRMSEAMKLTSGIGQFGSLSAGLGASAGMSEAMKLASGIGQLGSLSAGLGASTRMSEAMKLSSGIGEGLPAQWLTFNPDWEVDHLAHRAAVRRMHMDYLNKKARPKLWIGRRAARGGRLWAVACLQRRGFDVSHPFDDAVQWEDGRRAPDPVRLPGVDDSPHCGHELCQEPRTRGLPLTIRMTPAARRGRRHRWRYSSTGWFRRVNSSSYGRVRLT